MPPVLVLALPTVSRVWPVGVVVHHLDLHQPQAVVQHLYIWLSTAPLTPYPCRGLHPGLHSWLCLYLLVYNTQLW